MAAGQDEKIVATNKGVIITERTVVDPSCQHRFAELCASSLTKFLDILSSAEHVEVTVLVERERVLKSLPYRIPAA